MRINCLLPELSNPGKTGCALPDLDVPEDSLPSADLLRTDLGLPELSEVDVVRYFTALSRLNYGLDDGLYPLGSCTMKYNPKWHEDIVKCPGFAEIHPYEPEYCVQGALELMWEMQGYLAEITGMAAASLVPLAGAQGEYAGLMIVKAYQKERGKKNKNRILIPDSAHGTNPASATMSGFEVTTIGTDPDGNIDIESLGSMMTDDVAALTLTLPNTLGLFDPRIQEISSLVHERGALLGGDGANLNALFGLARFGDLGFDYVQLNLHKSFSAPHGGGGPGSGPICVKSQLSRFLPSPLVTKKEGQYSLSSPPQSIGRISSFYGNFGVVVRAYVYIRSLGAQGLAEVSRTAILNANYLKEKLKAYYNLPYDRTCMHEVVFSGKRFKAKGISTMDIAKRLMDYGFHPPTVYFPLIVEEALMIEPTETESKKTLDSFIDAMIRIAGEIEKNPDVLHFAPHNSPVRRLDEVKAARQLDLRWDVKREKVADGVSN